MRDVLLPCVIDIHSVMQTSSPPGVAIKEKLLFGSLAKMGLIYTDIFMYLHSNNEVYLRYYSDYFNLFN